MFDNFSTETFDLNEALKIAEPHVFEWDKLALLFGLKCVTIDNIRADRDNKSPQLCLESTISEWLGDDKYGASKEQLEQAVGNLELPELVSYL